MKNIKITSICLLSTLFLGGSAFATEVHSTNSNNLPILIAANGSKTEINNEPICGAPYQKIWNFKATKAGTYKIEFSYARPWEKNTPPAKTEEYTIEVSEGANTSENVILKSDEINKINVGQEFNVSLEENGSTGYSWTYSTDSDSIVAISESIPTADLKNDQDKLPVDAISTNLTNKKVSTKNAVKNTNIKKTNAGPICGAPTNKVWNLKLDKTGTYKIKFYYARSWEKKKTPAKTVEYTVEVLKGNKSTQIVNLKSGEINKVNPGQKFNVTLQQNASTGYSWSYNIVKCK